MERFPKSDKLEHVCYDIRGPVHKEALRLEEEGHKILKLNIGNPAPFGFEAPDEILVDVLRNLPSAQGYCDSKGLYSARKAIVQYYQSKDIRSVTVNDVYIGNGVSELITMAMQALLNDGDEVLIPMPDYPLWTAAATLAGGKAVHYLCDEQADWFPDVEDIKSKVTSRTKAIVVINPNNPTGAVYSKELLLEIVEVARQNNLIIFADEIYDKILYDGAPLLLPFLDLLDTTGEGVATREGCILQKLFDTETESLLSLEVLLFASLLAVMELLVTLMLCCGELLEFAIDLLAVLLIHWAKLMPLCCELYETAVCLDRVLDVI